MFVAVRARAAMLWAVELYMGGSRYLVAFFVVCFGWWSSVVFGFLLVDYCCVVLGVIVKQVVNSSVFSFSYFLYSFGVVEV